jgi:hypothetical protein
MSSMDGEARILEIRRLISNSQATSETLEDKIVKIEWEGDSCRRFLDDVDVFIEVSQGNINVQEVYLDPYWYENYIRRWEPVQNTSPDPLSGHFS